MYFEEGKNISQIAKNRSWP